MKFFVQILVGCAAFALSTAVSQGQGAQKTPSAPAESSDPTGHPGPDGPYPDWTGIWVLNFPKPGDPPAEVPSLEPAAAAQLKTFEEEDARNQEPATDAANCLPPGMPTIMFMPYDVEFLFTPGRVTIIQEAYMQVRRVFLDGRGHPAKLDPTFNGHSIGHWEGDTLVIDTVRLGHKTPIGYSRLRHGPNLHVVERIRLTSPDQMEDRMTLTDPDVLAKPWHTLHTFTRHREWDQLEYICEENNRNQIDQNGQVSPGLRK
jgi:hypothetical protein